MKRRFWISAALTLPVFMLAMAEMLPDFHSISLAATFALDSIYAGDAGRALGRISLFRARRGSRLKTVSPNMFTLIAIGTGAAYLFSLFALVFPEIFPASMRDAHTGFDRGLF